MSAVIKIKNSSTADAVPTSSDLVQGELAVNVTDKRIFTENASGTVVELGTNPSILTLPDGSASAPTLTNDGDTNTGIFFPAADTIAFAEGGVEAMRLDSSGNMGLGTSSPVSRLHIRGTAATKLLINSADNTADRGVYFAAADNTELGYVSQEYSTGTFTISAGTGTYSVPMVFRTSGSERMRLDASGNLGVGTTSPVSNNSGARALQLDGGSYGVDLRLTNTATGATATNGSAVALDSTNFYLWNYENAFMAFGTNNTERARIDSSGRFLVGRTTDSDSAGVTIGGDGFSRFNTDGQTVLVVNRNTNDGTLLELRQAGTNEGTISVSGTTVSYNGGHLARYAQTVGAKDESIKKGTVLSNLDEMNSYTAPTTYWTEEDELPDGVNVGDVKVEEHEVANEQLNKVKVSDVEGDVNVAGVFVNWSHDEKHEVDEINMAMTGDMIIRIAQGTTVARGDLLMSAGDGTAKPQGDDIVRAKTVAKVTSTHVTCTYEDGSYCVPCVLMAC